MDTRKSPPATQADIRSLSEKTDGSMHRLEEKTDSSIRRLDAKIDANTSRLAKEIVATQAAVREIQKTMSTKSDIDRVIGVIDAFTGKIQASSRAAVLHGRALTETGVTLRDHEKRLRSIEVRAH